MKRCPSLLTILALLLAACSSPGAQPPSTLLTPENAFGATLPEGARIVASTEFEQLLRSGDLTLITPANTEDAAEREARAAADGARLNAVANKSEALTDLLREPPNAVPSDSGDLVATARTRDGQSFEVLTLGAPASLRTFTGAADAASKAEDALAVYRAVYEDLEAGDRTGLPAPDALRGRPLADIESARAQLEQQLSARSAPDLDGALEDGSFAEVEAASAGNGADRDSPCPNSASGGLFANFRWTLKTSLTSVKNQGSRGTCWAFASIGAIETRERVVNGTWLNLSEQFFNSLRKTNGASDEGDAPGNALDDIAGRGERIAEETHWTYNRSATRTRRNGANDGQKGVCRGYDGFCSENVHQAPQTCTEFLGMKFCGFKTPRYTGSLDIKASYADTVWANDSGRALPLATLRQLLASGQPLIASMETRPDFMSGGDANGFVTGLTGRRSGGHAVLLVGFVSDASARTSADARPPTMTGGTGGGWFIVKNSWGCNWGDRGYVYLPVRYLQRNGWTIDKLDMSGTRSSQFTTYRRSIKGLPPTPGITGVTVSASSTSVASAGTTTLSAAVNGTGSFDNAVTWSIVSGGGTLSSTTGASITLTAPTGPAQVVVRATSVVDASKFGQVTVTVAAPTSSGPVLNGVISPWTEASSGQVRVVSGTTILTSASATPSGTTASFSLPLTAPAATLLHPFDFTECTPNTTSIPANPATVKHAGGDLQVKSGSGATLRLVPSLEPDLDFFLLYVDQRVKVDMTCGFETYRYDFPAAGWYVVRVSTANAISTFSGAPLSSLGTTFKTAAF